MKDNHCPHCTDHQAMQEIGTPVCDLDVSTLYLFNEQSHPGRVIVAYKDHVSEIVDLDPEQRSRFMEDINMAARAIHQIYAPDKINYGMYGDLVRHLHVHLVPKYKDELEWGDVFAMNPHENYLSENDREAVIEKIRSTVLNLK